MQIKTSVLRGFFLAVGLIGCQRAQETKPAPDPGPIWFLDSYAASRGYTFSRDMLVKYVATCLEPSSTAPSESGCVDLLPHVGTFDQLSVTTSGTSLLVTTKEREYHFRIIAVHSETSTSGSDEKSDE